jgi:predicted Zn finger-like uncharacterized protein
MLIQCPFCQATAKIPDDREGAKVKCGSCGKVYAAVAPGSRGGRARSSNTTLKVMLAIGAAAAIVVFAAILNRSRAPKFDAAPPAPVVEAQEKVDRVGWDSELVKLVRACYDAAFAYDTNKLALLIDVPRAVERERERGATLAEHAAMQPEEREAFLRGVLEQFTKGEGDTAIAKWKPFDGEVKVEEDALATVHVQVAGRDPATAAENRTMEWRLARDTAGRWRAFSWERYISPEEARARASSRSKEITRVTLGEGDEKFSLYQADPRPLPHFEDTPPDVRARVDAAALQLIDFSLRPKENNLAQAELVAIGRPSIPILLTKMYEIRIVDDTTLSQVGKIHHTLRDITGYDPGFSVTANDADSDMKREIAVKAWFAWFLRKGERFEEKKVGADALEGLIKPTERDLREIEAEKRAKAGGE